MNSSGKQFKLSSWKAIANFFGCSEKTVRRWESNEGLPVYRHKHLSGARVFAYQKELELWFTANKQLPKSTPAKIIKKLTIALIPFDFFCADQSKAFLPDAICENLISDIASISSLTTISYSSTRLLVNNKIPLIQLVKEVALDYYVEGSLSLDGASMRLNIRLVNALNQTVEWSAQYQDLITHWHNLRRRIVADLLTSLPLSNIDNEMSFSSSTLENHTAWEYLHQARFESLKWTTKSIERAIQLLKAAQKLVGKSDIVLANLGRAYLQQREAAIDCSSKPLNKAYSILEHLQQSNPQSFSYHALAGWYHYASGNMEQAIVALKHALLFLPNDPDTIALLSNCYLLTGQNDLAKPLIDTLQIVDPFTPLSCCMPGWYHLLNGEFALAKKPYEKMLAMDPDNLIARLFTIWVYALNQDIKKVENTYQGFCESDKQSFPYLLAHAFYDAVNKRESILRLNEQHTAIASTNEMYARFTAFAYAATNNIELATFWLERAFDLGFCAYPFLKHYDPFFSHHHQFLPLEKLLNDIRRKWQSHND